MMNDARRPRMMQKWGGSAEEEAGSGLGLLLIAGILDV